MADGRRSRAWADATFDNILTAGTPKVFDLLAGALEGSTTLTVSRVILDLEVGIPISSEIEYSQTIHIGIGVCSVEAFAIGPTAIPSPNIVAEYPPRGWLYVATKQCWQFKGVSEGQQKKNAMFQADLRGMRKIDKGILYIHMVSIDQTPTSSAVDMVGRTRAFCLT